MLQSATMDVTAIIPIERGDQKAHVPPLSDYRATSPLWSEAEFHCLDTHATQVVGGFWAGEPGSVSSEWPYTEICSILSGRVAIKDSFGAQREYGPGQGFIIPKGFVGEWITIEPSTKIYVAVY